MVFFLICMQKMEKFMQMEKLFSLEIVYVSLIALK